MNLLDDAKCFEVIRSHRWPEVMRCPHCHAHQRARQRYRCLASQLKFDDLTGTVFAGHHQPLRVWIAGLNLSHLQSAHELDIKEDDA